jgi:hypothetical protein
MADHPLLQMLKDDEFFTTTDPTEQAQILARQDAEHKIQHTEILLKTRMDAVKKTWLKRQNQLMTTPVLVAHPNQQGTVTKQ